MQCIHLQKWTSHFDWYIAPFVLRLLGLIYKPIRLINAAYPIMHLISSNGTYMKVLLCMINWMAQVYFTHSWHECLYQTSTLCHTDSSFSFTNFYISRTTISSSYCCLMLLPTLRKTEKYNHKLTNFAATNLSFFMKWSPVQSGMPIQAVKIYIKTHFLLAIKKKHHLKKNCSVSLLSEANFNFFQEVKTQRLTEVLELPVAPTFFQQVKTLKTSRNLIAPKS